MYQISTRQAILEGFYTVQSGTFDNIFDRLSAFVGDFFQNADIEGDLGLE